MDETLQVALRKLMDSGDESNAAFNVLIEDYTKYHLVLAVVGGIFLIVLIILAVFSWKNFKSALTVNGRRWTFEKKTYLAFGTLAVLAAMFMALIVAANVSTVAEPRDGFAGSIALLSTKNSSSSTQDFHQSVSAWLQSDSPETPKIVQARIDERIAWQRPKAIVSGVLLVAFAALGFLIWSRLIARSRAPDTRWTVSRIALFSIGVVTVPVSLVLMLMVMGNTQGALAPISLTLFLG